MDAGGRRAVFYFVVAAYSLVRGDYWMGLTLACGAAVFGLVAAGAGERGGAWTALVSVLFGVGVLSLVATIAW